MTHILKIWLRKISNRKKWNHQRNSKKQRIIKNRIEKKIFWFVIMKMKLFGKIIFCNKLMKLMLSLCLIYIFLILFLNVIVRSFVTMKLYLNLLMSFQMMKKKNCLKILGKRLKGIRSYWFRIRKNHMSLKRKFCH